MRLQEHIGQFQEAWVQLWLLTKDIQCSTADTSRLQRIQQSGFINGGTARNVGYHRIRPQRGDHIG